MTASTCHSSGDLVIEAWRTKAWSSEGLARQIWPNSPRRQSRIIHIFFPIKSNCISQKSNDNYRRWLVFHHDCSQVRNGMTSAGIKCITCELLCQCLNYNTSTLLTQCTNLVSIPYHYQHTRSLTKKNLWHFSSANRVYHIRCHIACRTRARKSTGSNRSRDTVE